MFQDWENIQELSPKNAAVIIFETFQKCRQNDEQDSMLLYAEHMVEVGQYLKRKLADRCRIEVSAKFREHCDNFRNLVDSNEQVDNDEYYYFLCEGLKRTVARRAM